jgi:hypothetical protein
MLAGTFPPDRTLPFLGATNRSGSSLLIDL